MSAPRAKKPRPPERGRPAFVDLAVQVRFTPAQLEAVDAAATAAGAQRNAWIRSRCEDALRAGIGVERRELAAARVLLDTIRGEDDDASAGVTVRFPEELGEGVTDAAKAAALIPSVWIREVALAAAMPSHYSDARRILHAVHRLT